jgi:hypothetical protein
MKWLSRVVHGWASTSVGYPTVDPGADVRAGIGASRTENPHRDIPSDTIEWSWDGYQWARWSTLSQSYDWTDLPVPESLVHSVEDMDLEPGSTFRLVDGAWRSVTART